MPQKSLNIRGLYCCKRKSGDEIINWEQTSREIFNFIRALTSPGPNATTFINNQKVLISSSELVKNAPIYKGIPGSIIKKEKDIFYVKTLDSYLKITGWQSNVKLKVGLRFHL